MTRAPPPHDPARTPAPAAAERAARRRRYASMTAAEIVAAMPPAELERNAHKGGTAAIAEQERRQAGAAGDAATPAPAGAIRGICDRCGEKMRLQRCDWRCGGCGWIVDRMTHFFRTQRPYQAVMR